MICGFFVFCFFSSQLCCPLRFQNSPQTYCGNFSFTTPTPGWISIPKSSVSLFSFYVLSHLLSKRMGCLSGCLVSSASIQMLFCGSCATFKGSFDEFMGEKVVSPSYSSTIFCCSLFWLKGVRWYLILLWFTFPNDIEYLFIHLLAIYVSSLEKYLSPLHIFKFSCHFVALIYIS